MTDQLRLPLSGPLPPSLWSLETKDLPARFLSSLSRFQGMVWRRQAIRTSCGCQRAIQTSPDVGVDPQRIACVGADFGDPGHRPMCRASLTEREVIRPLLAQGPFSDDGGLCSAAIFSSFDRNVPAVDGNDRRALFRRGRGLDILRAGSASRYDAHLATQNSSLVFQSEGTFEAPRGFAAALFRLPQCIHQTHRAPVSCY